MGGKGSGGGTSNMASGTSEDWTSDDYEANPSAYDGGFGGMDFAMPEFEMPDYSELFAQQQASQNSMLASQASASAKAQGLRDRDSLYAGYLDAAGTATDYVTGEIADEQSNARLMGIDYAITDEQKSQRISDYFASIWGEGNQMQLEGLIKKVGAPKGFKDFTVKRGDGSKYGAKSEATTTTETVSKGQKPLNLLDEEEDAGNAVLGGSANLLGV